MSQIVRITSVYCRREDGVCGWCDTEPAKEQIDALGTKYLACDCCFDKHGCKDAGSVVINVS